MLSLSLLASASTSIALLAGYGATSNLGERPGVEAAVYLHSPHLSVETSYYSADKIETGKGWGIHSSAELRYKMVGAGLSYSYRNGGEWTKHYPWLRTSLSRGPVSLVGEWALGGFNREKKLELRATARIQWFVVEPRVFVEWHLQGTAYGAVVMVGVGAGK